MVALWMMGDIFRFLYFILRDVPFTFILCVILQLLVDIAVFFQIFRYGDTPAAPQHFDLREFPHLTP